MSEPQYTYISTADQFQECLSHLQGCAQVAIDLEFDRNRMRYGFNLCLMQVYGNDKCFLIDPLSAGVDITLIFPILENPEVEIVVFAFREDLNLLRLLGCRPNNIYDINSAVKLLDYAKTSLSAMLEELLQIMTSKESQKSNWFNRPLSEAQLKYAAQDVLYLFQLKDAVVPLVEAKGISAWVEEENIAYDDMEFEEEPEHLKHKHKLGLSEVEWDVYRELLKFREDMGQQFNRPSYQVLDKEYLRDIARDPKQVAHWQRTKGIHKRLLNRGTEKKVAGLVSETLKQSKAAGRSEKSPAAPKLSRAEWNASKQRKVAIEKFHKSHFKPIQEEITERYGEFAAPIILGRKTVEELICGRLDDIKQYKIDLVQSLAKELSIDIAPFLNGTALNPEQEA